MRALLDREARRRHPAARSRRSPRYLLDPAESRYVARPTCWPATPTAACPMADAVPDGQLDFGGDRRRRMRSRPRAGALAVAYLVEPLIAALDAQGLRDLHDEIEVPLVRRAGPDGARRHRCRRRAAPPAQRRRWPPSARRSRQSIWEDGRRGVQRELDRHSCATILFDKLGLTPQKKTKTGFSTDAAIAGEAGRRAPDHRSPAALPRGREAALDLRRRPAGRGRTRRAHPRHLQPDGGPDRPAELRRAQPPQHPGSQRGGPRLPRSVRPGAGRRSSWSPTTTRSSCAASPTWPRTRG